MLLVGGWLRWPGDCSWSRLTALLLGRLLGCVALHWGSLDGACRSVKYDEARELIWLVPTKVFADLLLSLVTLRLTERAARTALLEMYMLTGRGHLADWLTDWLTELNCVVSLTVLRRTQVKTLLATIHVAFVCYHGKSSDCYLDSNLRKRYLVTEDLIMSEASMGGSHNFIIFAACMHPLVSLHQVRL
jgi:hypothetical protein